MTRMPADRWERMRALFDQAAALPAAEREAFLVKSCGDDQALLNELRSLLSGLGDEAGDQVVERVVRDAASQVAGPLRVGTAVGPYRITASIGEGGMGSVYLAERADGAFTRSVAIKVVRGGLDSARVVERFREERRILAGLDHPNIAAVMDGGSTDDGLPFLVMEYVDGEMIDRWCASRKTPIRDRVRLMRRVCDAVEHAHRQLVVHRDLKPANVLVTREGVPKLLDFGIAKILTGEAVGSEATATGVRAMTPDYASPEQIRGERVTTATDVHALGILLYELMTGHHPFREAAATPRELEEALLTRDPEPPSSAATRGNGARSGVGNGHPPASVLRRELAGDLDNIIMKALAKEPVRRYPSAAELSADLGRYLGGHPVTARPSTFAYRASKFLRRNAVGTAIAAAFLVTIVGAVIFSTRAYLRADRMRIEAETQRDRLEEINAFLARIFRAASPVGRQSPEEVTARDLLDAGAAAIETELGDRPEVAAVIETEIGRRYNDLGMLDKAEETLRAALEKHRSAGSLDGVDGVTTLTYLGQTLIDQGRHDEALAVMEDALARCERIPQTLPKAEIEARRVAARVHATRGEHEKGVPLLEALVDRLGEEPWRSDPEYVKARADVADDLGVLVERTGDYEEAIRLVRLAVELNIFVVGETHSRTGESWSNLAFAQNRAGRYEEAVESARRALAVHQATVGDDHMKTAMSRLNLADALVNVGELDSAEALYPKVLEVYKRVHGENGVQVGTVLNNAALIFLNGGAPERAVEKLEEAGRIYAAALGEDHEWVAITWHNTARALRQAGRHAEAEAMSRRTLAKRRKILGAGHPDVARSCGQLAMILIDRGRAAAAEPIAREATRIAEASLTAGHPVRIGAERQLARSLAELGRVEEAERILVAVHAASDSARGPEDRLTVAIAEQLETLRNGASR